MVHISHGNSKMGAIKSVSLPPGITCRDACPCFDQCYANKLIKFRKSVRKAYFENWKILKEDPEQYWREVAAAIMLSRFFRFHVAGDIVDFAYLTNMATIAARNTHCEILCFTKQYEFVNQYLYEYGVFPKNLHIIMSVWRGLNIKNPYKLPEAHVKYRDGSTTARDDAMLCDGNCIECVNTNGGCWTLQHGQQVVFNEH